MQFTLACAQISPKKADVQANLDLVASVALQAAGEGADLVLFPEASTSGYFLEGGVLESSLETDQLGAELSNRILPKLKRPVDVSVGFYQKSEGNLYNATAYIEFQPGSARVVHVYRKFFLPTYGVFDEERFVSRGKSLGIIESRFGRLGVLVCEDIWHSILPTLCAVSGALLLLVPSASPGRGFNGDEVQSHERYRRLMTAVCEEHGIWCANCQLCGFEGGKGLIGGSSVIDPLGVTVGQSPILEPHILLAKIDFELITIARSSSPLLSDLKSAWGDLQRISLDTVAD